MLQFRQGRKKKRPIDVQKSFHVKRGDTVMVIAGKDKGKTGVVRTVLTDRNKVIVDGLNIVKKAVRGNPMFGIQGGIIPMEAPIHVSNVMLYDTKNAQPTRTRKEVTEGENGKVQRVRVSVKSGEKIDA